MTVAQSEIARYVDQVRAALGDLPAQERDDLLEDLPDHLAEVAAEGQGSLEARLGPPAGYAAELRASAGLPVAGTENLVGRAGAVLNDMRGRLRHADVRIGQLLGYETVGEFIRQLRPAWWVLRGYLLAMVVTVLLDDGSEAMGLLPRLGGSEPAAVVILVGFVLGSIWLGRRSVRLARWPRRLMLAGTAILAVFALAGFAEADQQARGRSDMYSPVNGNPYHDIGDVYVYDSEGRLLTGVRLFDQNGEPIELGYMRCQEENEGMATSDWKIASYPRCPQNAPFTIRPEELPGIPQPATPTPGASPSGSVAPSGSPSPSGSGAPSGTAPSAGGEGR